MDYKLANGSIVDDNMLEEMAAVEQEDGTLLVFHAMISPSAKTLHEVGLR